MSGPVRSTTALKTLVLQLIAVSVAKTMASVEVVRGTKGAGPAPWTKPHNLAVVTAWWTVSGNPLFRGTNNKVEVLWKAILHEYDRLLTLPLYQPVARVTSPHVYRERTWRGLQSRFKAMQLLINRFIGDYGRARFVIQASGSDEDQYVKDAHTLYVKKWKKPFKLIPELKYLKSFPKYLFDIIQAAKLYGVDGLNGTKPKGGPGSRAVERTRMSDDEDEGPRPLGLRAAKKIAREEAEVAEVKARNLRAIQFEQEKFQERAALHRQTIEADQARAAADVKTAEVNRDVEDNNVMRMDLTHLPLKRQK